MANRTRNLTLCVAAAAMLAPTPAVFAKGRGGRGGRGGGRGRAAPMAPVNPTLAKDQEEITTDQTAYDKANAALTAAKAKLDHEFLLSPDYAAGQKNVDDAEAAMQKSREAALAKLAASNPEYKADIAKENAAQKQIEMLQAKHAGQSEIAAQAQIAFSLSGVTDKMERAALDSDPDYQAAKTKVAATNKALADLKTQFDDGLKDNTTIAPLLQAKTDAETKLASAKTKYQTDMAAPGGRNGGGGTTTVAGQDSSLTPGVR